MGVNFHGLPFLGFVGVYFHWLAFMNTGNKYLKDHFIICWGYKFVGKRYTQNPQKLSHHDNTGSYSTADDFVISCKKEMKSFTFTRCLWIHSHFQSIFPVCWLPWPPQMWTQPTSVWSLLWKVWRQLQCRNGSHTRLDPCTLWPSVCQGTIFHPRHPRGQKGHRCSIHNNQQTRSRSYSLKEEHHIYKST